MYVCIYIYICIGAPSLGVPGGIGALGARAPRDSAEGSRHVR